MTAQVLSTWMIALMGTLSEGQTWLTHRHSPRQVFTSAIQRYLAHRELLGSSLVRYLVDWRTSSSLFLLPLLRLSCYMGSFC